jgi:tetratricopeptide (TPR) repeat protein
MPRNLQAPAVAPLLKIIVSGILFLLAIGYRHQVGSALLLNLGTIWLERSSLDHSIEATQDKLMDFKKAESFLRRALDWQPTNASAYRSLGRVYTAMGAYEQAIHAFGQATRLSENPLAYEALGNAYQATGQQEQAIASWAKVGGTLAHLHAMLGMDYYRRGMLDQAITELEIALQIGDLTDHDKISVFQFLGGIYHEKGQLGEAILWQKRAIEIAPNKAELYDALGLTLLHAGEIDDTITVAIQAIALDPKLPGPHRTLAAAYADKGMFEEAIREYQRALLLARDNVWAHYGLGVAYWRMGNSEQAMAEWQAALAINPTFDPARRSLEAGKPVP